MLGGTFEETVQVEKYYTPLVPPNLVWQQYATNQNGYLVTWGNGPTIRVFNPSGNVILNWDAGTPYSHRVEVGRDHFYVYKPTTVTGSGAQDYVWQRVELVSGKTETLIATSEQAFFVCDPERWVIKKSEKEWLLWNEEKIAFSRDDRYGNDTPSHAWVMSGTTCRLAINLHEQSLLFELDPDGKILKRWTVSAEDRQMLDDSGSEGPQVFPLKNRWVILPGVSFISPDRLNYAERPNVSVRNLGTVLGEDWVGVQVSPGEWRVCYEDLHCKSQKAPPTPSGLYARATGRSPFTCYDEYGPAGLRPDAPSIGVVTCINPDGSKVLKFGKKLAPGEFSVVKFVVPLEGGGIVAGVPSQIVDPMAGGAIPLEAAQMAGAYGRYAATKSVESSRGRPPYSQEIGFITKDGVAWGGSYQTQDSYVGPQIVGVTSSGDSVLVSFTYRMVGEAPPQGPKAMDILVVPVRKGLFKFARTLHVSLSDFSPRMDGGGYGEPIVRRPVGPFIDLKDRMWMVGYRRVSKSGGVRRYPGETELEVMGVSLRTGRVVARFPLPDPVPMETKPPTPSQDLRERIAPLTLDYPGLKEFRWIAGTETFMLHRGRNIEIIDLDGHRVKYWRCEKFCNDVIEWYPMKPDEWYAEKKDGLYLVKFPPGPIK